MVIRRPDTLMTPSARRRASERETSSDRAQPCGDLIASHGELERSCLGCHKFSMEKSSQPRGEILQRQILHETGECPDTAGKHADDPQCDLRMPPTGFEHDVAREIEETGRFGVVIAVAVTPSRLTLTPPGAASALALIQLFTM